MSRKSMTHTLTDADKIKLQKLIYALEADPKIYQTLTDNEVLGIICIILNKSSYHRSFAEMDILKKATRNNIYFQNMIEQPQGELLWERCLRKMSYNYLPMGFNLFREGDVGTTFYIILQGTVSIHKKYQINKSQFQERELVQLHDGHSFGELALENDAPRSASVKAIVPTHLAVLEKEDYMVIKKTLYNQQKQMYFEEFAKLSIFSDWKFVNIKGLFDYVKFYQFGLNHYVYKEGEPSNYVYFIQSGEFKVTIIQSQVTKALQIVRQDKQNKFIAQDVDDIILLQQLSAYDKKQQNNSEKIEELFQKKKYGSLIQTDKKLTITLKYVGAGEMFGELEVLKNSELPRQMSVITTQEANKIYQIHKKDFLRVLYYDQQLNQTLITLNDNKLRQILIQIKGYQKNFLDQQDKQLILERTQNKNFLQLEERKNDDQQQKNKFKTVSSNKNVNPRRIVVDNKAKEISLTLEEPEIQTARIPHTFVHKHTLSQLKLPTDRTNTSITKIRSQNVSPDTSIMKQFQQQTYKYKHTSPFSSTSRISIPEHNFFKKDLQLKKFQNSQIYFNNSLPFVMQNRYIRVKSNINKLQIHI